MVYYNQGEHQLMTSWRQDTHHAAPEDAVYHAHMCIVHLAGGGEVRHDHIPMCNMKHILFISYPLIHYHLQSIFQLNLASAKCQTIQEILHCHFNTTPTCSIIHILLTLVLMSDQGIHYRSFNSYPGKGSTRTHNFQGGTSCSHKISKNKAQNRFNICRNI